MPALERQNAGNPLFGRPAPGPERTIRQMECAAAIAHQQSAM
jgi:hypothetical protein